MEQDLLKKQINEMHDYINPDESSDKTLSSENLILSDLMAEKMELWFNNFIDEQNETNSISKEELKKFYNLEMLKGECSNTLYVICLSRVLDPLNCEKNKIL